MSKGLTKQFEDFFNERWGDNEMYAPSEFEFMEGFGVDRHCARYHLMTLVYMHKLFRVKYSNKTHYGKQVADNVERLAEYVWMGLEITK